MSAVLAWVLTCDHCGRSTSKRAARSDRELRRYAMVSGWQCGQGDLCPACVADLQPVMPGDSHD